MKCPKCGFNSFEFYDKCKKCSVDLLGFKQTYSISSLVLPLEAKERLAAEFRSAEGETDQVNDTPETHNDIFSFNLPEDSSSLQPNQGNDPFNFDEPSPNVNELSGTISEDDAFADLLESTPRSEASPFEESKMDDTIGYAPVKSTDSTPGPGEFDLENFSWDDTPTAASPTGSVEPADDFDTLFGDTKETPKK